jgi:hypothetical protein
VSERVAFSGFKPNNRCAEVLEESRRAWAGDVSRNVDNQESVKRTWTKPARDIKNGLKWCGHFAASQVELRMSVFKLVGGGREWKRNTKSILRWRGRGVVELAERRVRE